MDTYILGADAWMTEIIHQTFKKVRTIVIDMFENCVQHFRRGHVFALVKVKLEGTGSR
ncbi:hypothetical protein NKI80_31095 [Mesorhizobium sp. M0387]|uniref:hypothetical protein n=1 Tax=Mesorhizobium sp. M0387 TaxID=2956940 RepID=UPI003335C97E